MFSLVFTFLNVVPYATLLIVLHIVALIISPIDGVQVAYTDIPYPIIDSFKATPAVLSCYPILCQAPQPLVCSPPAWTHETIKKGKLLHKCMCVLILFDTHFLLGNILCLGRRRSICARVHAREVSIIYRQLFP